VVEAFVSMRTTPSSIEQAKRRSGCTERHALAPVAGSNERLCQGHTIAPPSIHPFERSAPRWGHRRETARHSLADSRATHALFEIGRIAPMGSASSGTRTTPPRSSPIGLVSTSSPFARWNASGMTFRTARCTKLRT
jgi:hypothetical protein